jgi:hypothetical protein
MFRWRQVNLLTGHRFYRGHDPRLRIPKSTGVGQTFATPPPIPKMETFAKQVLMFPNTHTSYTKNENIVLPSTFISFTHPCVSASHWEWIQFCHLKICSSWERWQAMTASLLVKESICYILI